MPRKKRAQVAMEFVMLIGLVFFVMLIFLAFIRNYIVDVRSDKDQELLKDIAYAVQAEINIAAGVGDGYERNFLVPDMIDHTNYTINITSNQIWALTEKAEIVLQIPPITGNLTKGGNTIRKANGIIYLNVGVENDTGTPIVNLLGPPDQSTDIDGDIIFSYQVSDLDSGITNCSLIFNNTVNQTDESIVEGLTQYFFLNGVSLGTYNWTVNCTDDSPNNNSAQPADWRVTVELVYNDPPTTPTSITCGDATCSATFSDSVSINCSGSTDPEGDAITYYIDAFYAPTTYILQKVEAESGSFTYAGGYGTTTSCSCNAPSGNCIRDLTWDPGTWAYSRYHSAFASTINRIFVYYCSENDGDDFYKLFSDGQERDSWTTSYEDNNWELRTLYNASLDSGDNFDINCSRGTSASYCGVDYVIFDDRNWASIGNHLQNTTFSWNLSGVADQDLVALRCRAVDEAGSGIYSNYYSPLMDMQLDSGGDASGSTINPDFNSSAAGWMGLDWNYDAFEVNPTEDYQGTGGDPGGRVRVNFPSGKNDEVGGFWRQGVDVSVNNPSNVTCKFGWRASTYDPTPITFKVYVFLDSGSGEPTIGQQVWVSSPITSTTSWVNQTVDCTSKVTDAGTYYYKIAAWVETDGGSNDGPYEISFDNAQVIWQE